jgi:hypothetical protein
MLSLSRQEFFIAKVMQKPHLGAIHQKLENKVIPLDYSTQINE